MKTSLSLAPVASDPSLELLLARVAAHEPAALIELFDATISGCWRTALAAGLGERDAECLIEDVYWQLWREAPRCLDGGLGVRHWLHAQIQTACSLATWPAAAG